MLQLDSSWGCCLARHRLISASRQNSTKNSRTNGRDREGREKPGTRPRIPQNGLPPAGTTAHLPNHLGCCLLAMLLHFERGNFQSRPTLSWKYELSRLRGKLLVAAAATKPCSELRLTGMHGHLTASKLAGQTQMTKGRRERMEQIGQLESYKSLVCWLLSR